MRLASYDSNDCRELARHAVRILTPRVADTDGRFMRLAYVTHNTLPVYTCVGRDGFDNGCSSAITVLCAAVRDRLSKFARESFV